MTARLLDGLRVLDLGGDPAPRPTPRLRRPGDPDRAPIRSTEPTGYAHSGPEAAFAAMTALASGLSQRVDLSMQEVVLIANMAAPGRYFDTHLRGSRRGANIGRTREIWPTL